MFFEQKVLENAPFAIVEVLVNSKKGIIDLKTKQFQLSNEGYVLFENGKENYFYSKESKSLKKAVTKFKESLDRNNCFRQDIEKISETAISYMLTGKNARRKRKTIKKQGN